MDYPRRPEKGVNLKSSFSFYYIFAVDGRGASGFSKLGLKKCSQRVKGFRCVTALRRDKDLASVRAHQGHQIKNAFTVNGHVALGEEYFGFELAGHSDYLRGNPSVDSKSVGYYEFLHQNWNVRGGLLQSYFPSVIKIFGVY
jgi:hypothetical protein